MVTSSHQIRGNAFAIVAQQFDMRPESGYRINLGRHLRSRPNPLWQRQQHTVVSDWEESDSTNRDHEIPCGNFASTQWAISPMYFELWNCGNNVPQIPGNAFAIVAQRFTRTTR